MTDILKIPGNSQAYLIAVRDAAQDKFDVTKFAYGYVNATPFPDAWAYWKMEESGLETRADSTGNDHPLLIDTDLLEPGEDFDQVAGKVGYAMEYVPHLGAYVDETYVEAEMGLSEDTSFSVAFWFKHHVLGNPGSYVEWYISTYNLFMSIGFNHDQTNAYIYAQSAGPYPSGTQYLITETSGSFAPDAWHFVVWEFDGTGLYLYVDNTLVASDLGESNNVSGSNYWTMGGVYDDEMSIAFDEFGIWIGTALDEDQRDYLWNGGAGRSLY